MTQAHKDGHPNAASVPVRGCPDCDDDRNANGFWNDSKKSG